MCRKGAVMVLSAHGQGAKASGVGAAKALVKTAVGRNGSRSSNEPARQRAPGTWPAGPRFPCRPRGPCPPGPPARAHAAGAPRPPPGAAPPCPTATFALQKAQPCTSTHTRTHTRAQYTALLTRQQAHTRTHTHTHAHTRTQYTALLTRQQAQKQTETAVANRGVPIARSGGCRKAGAHTRTRARVRRIHTASSASTHCAAKHPGQCPRSRRHVPFENNCARGNAMLSLHAKVKRSRTGFFVLKEGEAGVFSNQHGQRLLQRHLLRVAVHLPTKHTVTRQQQVGAPATRSCVCKATSKKPTVHRWAQSPKGTPDCRSALALNGGGQQQHATSSAAVNTVGGNSIPASCTVLGSPKAHSVSPEQRAGHAHTPIHAHTRNAGSRPPKGKHGPTKVNEEVRRPATILHLFERFSSPRQRRCDRRISCLALQSRPQAPAVRTGRGPHPSP